MKTFILVLTIALIAPAMIGCISKEEPQSNAIAAETTTPPAKGGTKPAGMTPDTIDDPRPEGK